jgi:hypothetical protein
MSDLKLRFSASGKPPGDARGDAAGAGERLAGDAAGAGERLAGDAHGEAGRIMPMQREGLGTPPPMLPLAQPAVAPAPEAAPRAARPGTGSSACPSCGLELKVGYVRCPRCKYAFDKNHVRRGGGTAMVSRTVPWTIVAVLAVATAAIVVIADRDPPTRLLSSYDVVEASDAEEVAGEEGAGEEGDEDGEGTDGEDEAAAAPEDD